MQGDTTSATSTLSASAAHRQEHEDLAARARTLLNVDPEHLQPVVITGPIGGLVNSAIRRVAAASDLPGFWLHSLPPRPDGDQRCIVQEAARDGEQDGLAMTADDMGGLLDQLTAQVQGPALLIVESVQQLSTSSANALVVWAQLARLRGTRLLLGYAPAADIDAVGTLVAMNPEVHWIDVQSPTPERLRHALERAARWTGADELDRAAGFCAGSPGLTTAVCRAAAIEGEVTDSRFPHVYANALESSAVPQLLRQGPDAVALALVMALAGHTVDAAEAAGALGILPRTARRLERFLRESGLAPDSPEAQVIVHRVVAAQAGQDIRRRAASCARGLLEAHRAQAVDLFALHSLVGDDVAGRMLLAKDIFTAALFEDAFDRALQVAQNLEATSSDPGEIAWARAAQLAVWMRSDWAALHRQREWLTDPAVLAELDGARPSAWLALESPATVELLLEAPAADGAWSGLDATFLSGRMATVPTTYLRGVVAAAETGPTYASYLAVCALIGHRASPRLAALSECAEALGGPLGVGAALASRISAAWLFLADYEAAARWAAIAAFTAAENEAADCAMGYLIGAQAQLRLGNFGRAREQAELAKTNFARFNATTMMDVCVWTLAHIDAEDVAGAEPADAQALAAALPDAVHPLWIAYRAYVCGRTLLRQGETDVAVRYLFGSGRDLARAGIENPSVLNWLPHLVRVFRAGGLTDFHNQMTDDFASRWRRWDRIEPAAAGRRVRALADVGTELGLVPKESPNEPGPSQLSPAERKVVVVVLEGLSNREVARKLFLSKRTIDTHLGNVYRKLGLSSRDELICWARRFPLSSDGASEAAYG